MRTAPTADVRVTREIERLHRVLEHWLRGTAPRTRRVFARFEAALDDGFVIVHPSGARQAKSEVCAEVWQAYAARPPPFVIEIRNVAVQALATGVWLAGYEEWQHGAARSSARISSALFVRRATDAPLRWLHLHETWLPGRAPPAQDPAAGDGG